MKRALAFLLALAADASANSYRFIGGAMNHHDNRCASVETAENLMLLVNKSQLTLGHGQATLALYRRVYSFGEDSAFWPYSRFVLSPELTAIVKLDTSDCADSRCVTMNATISLIRRVDGIACYEQWRGTALEIYQ